MSRKPRGSRTSEGRGPRRAVVTMRTVRARDVMSAPVIMIDVDDSIWQAWSVMLDSGLRHLVVCDRNHCVGVLDDRTLFSLWPADPFGVRYTSVRRLIPPRTTCVLPDTSLSQVARVMLDQRLDAQSRLFSRPHVFFPT